MLSPAKKVLLVSSGQPSLNPRLVKEADALAEAGYNVTVLYSYWNAWGTALDKGLLQSKKWNTVIAGGDPVEHPFIYLFSRLLHKVYYLLTKFTGVMFFAPLAVARSSFFLILAAKKHQADLYIGHNLGALAAVVLAAKKHNAVCGFDAEDFHRNEVSNNPKHFHLKTSKAVEDRYTSHLNYLTASSPLIGDAYQALYPQVKKQVILNSFPKSTLPISIYNSDKPIKLFWFSQTVGFGRGLEDVIQALNKLPHIKFELHLLGDANNVMRKQLAAFILHSGDTIRFHSPIPADEIMEFAAQFDIGIAAETDTPHNRNLCLTNKVFTYIQAGLPVLASNTTAQMALMQHYQVAGTIYPNGDTGAIANALAYYNDNRPELHHQKALNYNLGQTLLNWENEKVRFLDLIQQTLSNE